MAAAIALDDRDFLAFLRGEVHAAGFFVDLLRSLPALRHLLEERQYVFVGHGFPLPSRLDILVAAMIMRIVPTRRFSPAFIATFSSLENFSRTASS
jgi:hypothetical protein